MKHIILAALATTAMCSIAKANDRQVEFKLVCDFLDPIYGFWTSDSLGTLRHYTFPVPLEPCKTETVNIKNWNNPHTCRLVFMADWARTNKSPVVNDSLVAVYSSKLHDHFIAKGSYLEPHYFYGCDKGTAPDAGGMNKVLFNGIKYDPTIPADELINYPYRQRVTAAYAAPGDPNLAKDGFPKPLPLGNYNNTAHDQAIWDATHPEESP